MSSDDSIPGLNAATSEPLFAMAELLTRTFTGEAELETYVAQMARLYAYDASVLVLTGADGRVERIVAGRSESPSALAEDRLFGLLERAAAQDRAVEEILEDDDPWRGLGYVRGVALSVHNDGARHGVIGLFRLEDVASEPANLRGLATLARLLASAIDRGLLAEKESRQRRRTHALSDIVREIHSNSDLEAVLSALGKHLEPILPFSKLLLLTHAPGRGFAVRTLAKEDGREVIRVRDSVPVRAVDGPVAVIAGTERAGAGIDAERTAAEAGLLDGLARYAVVPILSNNETLGALCWGNVREAHLGPDDIALLEDVAIHLATPIQRDLIARSPAGFDDDLGHANGLKALGELVAGVAHDFNNVLSVILGRAQMLRERLEEPDTLRSLGVIEKAALDGAATVRRIQEFAKRSAEDPLEVSVDQLIEDAAERATTRARTRPSDRRIWIEVEASSRAHVLGSPAELRQVLTNLVYNGIDAMPDGGTLHLRSGRDPDLGRAWIDVEDTGQGMSEETQRRIFEPFFSTKGDGGTGLGLSVSYGVVQRHGGELSVFSEPARGTRFRLSLPIVGEPKRASQPPQGDRGPSPLLRRTRTCGSILLIDDDAAVRETLAEILGSEGHEVTTAASGAEGLEQFDSGMYDLVLTDLGMPNMNGWEVLERIKATSPTTPVGVITGWGASLDEAQVASAGGDLVLSKPFRFDQVLEVVGRVLDARLQREAGS